MGEHAGVRRAPCSCGEDGAVSGGRGGGDRRQRRRRRGRPCEAHAAAHLRIVPVDAPPKADQPPELRLVAVPCGLVHGLAHRGLGTAGTHLFSAVVASSAVAARESWPSLPDTQSETKSGSRGPKGAKHAMLHEGASRHRPGSRVGHKGQRARARHEVTVSYLSRVRRARWTACSLQSNFFCAEKRWTAPGRLLKQEASQEKMRRNLIMKHINSPNLNTEHILLSFKQWGLGYARPSHRTLRQLVQLRLASKTTHPQAE